MDIDLLRSLYTVVLFAAFIGIVLWAWSDRPRARFDAAARSPLEEDGADASARAGEGRQGARR
ncbi:MAG: cbb3-type cytochrome c oxidase subunit 3 [Betaproteobacteria bacterium]|nr:cbb3-type cytochrome c oxidase subunit 3 [Betaproteobacteria bacterium]